MRVEAKWKRYRRKPVVIEEPGELLRVLAWSAELIPRL